MQFWLFCLFLSHDITKIILPNLLKFSYVVGRVLLQNLSESFYSSLFFFKIKFFFVSQLSENFDLFLKKSVKFDYFAKYWRYVQKGNVRFCKNLLFSTCESFRIIQLTVLAVSCDKWNTRKHAFCGTAGPRGTLRKKIFCQDPPFFMCDCIKSFWWP